MGDEPNFRNDVQTLIQYYSTLMILVLVVGYLMHECSSTA